MRDIIIKKFFILLFICFNFLLLVNASEPGIVKPSNLPEIAEVNELINNKGTVEGIVFTIYESDESSLEEIIPRLLYYVALIRQKHTMPIAVVSHGDEMLSLTIENKELYPEVHKNVIKLVKNYDVYFHVCGSFARLNDLEHEDFPDYIDVVPFGPTQISDYLSLDFQRIDLEITY